MESEVQKTDLVDETVVRKIVHFAKRIAKSIGTDGEDAAGVALLTAWECVQREDCSVGYLWGRIRYAVYRYGFEDVAVRVPQSSQKQRFSRGCLTADYKTVDWELQLADYPEEIKLLYLGYTQREAAKLLGISLHILRKRIVHFRELILSID